MCGLLGYFSNKPNPKFERALKIISHRGPDGLGTYRSENGLVELGHTRLAIVDPSESGSQPMVDKDSGCILVYNGEIYNCEELRKDLIDQGVQFSGHSDTEVLFNLLKREGTKVLSRLRGIFAFVFYQPKTDTLILVRDALGVKPLYFKVDEDGIIFGSELKALVHLKPDDLSIEPIAVYRYLTYIWAPGEMSPAKGFLSLGPGEFLEVQDGNVTARKTWYQLPVYVAPPKITNIKQALSGVVQNLELAVQRQMMSDVPLGAFLSGGVDSSAIVALAKRQAPDIQCFTIDTPNGEDGFANDLPFAQSVAKHLDVRLEVIKVDPECMIRDLEKMVLQLDEPLADPAALNAFYISRQAHKMGFKVLLSGVGGDDVFSGYRRHQAEAIHKYWDLLPSSINKQVSKYGDTLDKRKPLQRRLAKLITSMNFSGDERLVNFFRWVDKSTLDNLLTPDFKAKIPSGSAEAPFLEALKGLPSKVTNLDRMLLLEQKFYLPDHNLLYADRMSMATGIEVRVPFLDEDLVAFAATIPDRFRQRFGTGKWILKKAMEPYLPNNILYRPKTGFGAPLRSWIRGPLRLYIDEVLSFERLKDRNIFNPLAVRNLIEQNSQGLGDYSYTIFSILCIEIWSAHFIDNPSQICRGLVLESVGDKQTNGMV